MIGIIGAGISGLVAAKVLKENGIDFRVFENSDVLGGRIKSQVQDGFIFDEGFQVLLTSYPQVKKHINLHNLELQSFNAGALIYHGSGHTSVVADPLRNPRYFFSTLFAPVGSIKDKFKILQLRFKTSTAPATTDAFLRAQGFSNKIIKSFFRPFFSGVFLENELRTDANYFLFLYQRFSEGLASLPKEGMQALPHQLAATFLKQIQFSAQVESIEAVGEAVTVKLTSGEVQQFSQLILAVDGKAAQKLLPSINLSPLKRVVTTVYFATKTLPSEGKFLFLNGSGAGRVNHIAFLSAVQPNYSQGEEHLVSVNLLDTNEVAPEMILQEIESWGLFKTHDWRHLKTCLIHYAQPEEMRQGKSTIRYGNIVLAGDYTQTASIEGAMLSGEVAADEIMKQLKR